MRLFDMHSHILPAFDDGAKTVEESLVLIDALKKQGVNNICLTPHFYTNERSLEDFLKERKKAFELFLPHIPDDVNIVLGTEVYVTDYLFNNSRVDGITYGKSKYVLTEFPYGDKFTERTMQKFYALMNNYGLKPVMPHVERYPRLINDPDFIEELRDIGVVIQTNIQNYSDKASFFRKRKLMKLIEAGLIDILGSDTHSLTHNSPLLYSEALKNITEKCGKRRVDIMMHNAERIFSKAIGN